MVCNGTYGPDPAQSYRSPCCDHPMEEIVSGRELRIRSVDYTLDAAAPGPGVDAADSSPAQPLATASAV
jgi:hypothetical protein